MSGSLCCRRFPIVIKSRLMQPRRNGYIILLPEISPNVPENPALIKDNMPEFSSLTTERCVSTLGKHLLNFEHGVRMLEQSIDKAGCSDVVREVIEPLEKINAPLDTSWGIVKSLYMTNTKLMPATTYIPLHHRARRARSSKFYSKTIYNACKECDPSKLSEEESRVVDKFLLEGRLAGLDLKESEREILAQIHMKMAEHKTDFTKRVEVSMKMYEHTIFDSGLMREMPDQLLRLMAYNKEEPSKGPWKLSLDPQVRDQFMAYCPDRDLRWNLWEAITRVASQTLENSELHNSVTLEHIRALRKQEATVLGFKNYAEMSMQTKMAGTLENVQHTLGTILHIAKPVADKEIANLQQFAWERGFEGSLKVWDISYWQRKQKRTLFNYQEEALTDFLPFDKVWKGLLSLCEKLFDIKIVENNKVDRWHSDVRFFHVYEDSKTPVAGFYLDPYVREDKLVGSREAWVVNLLPAARIHKSLPLSTLILQLDPPIYGKPALMTWSDVQVLFKQFGQIMQQLLTTVNYAEVAGQSYIEWDAIDIVGNVFLHWLKDPAVLDSISGHYATGEKLPSIPFAEIHKHLAGYKLCEDLFKAHLDLELYTTKDFWQDIMKRLWRAHFILPHDEWNAMPCSFSAVVTEQWCAAYYSRLWSQIVAADVFSAFTEPDVDVSSIGARFRDTYLAFGGSCPPGEVFRRFRGRDPSPEAFLKSLGLH